MRRIFRVVGMTRLFGRETLRILACEKGKCVRVCVCAGNVEQMGNCERGTCHVVSLDYFSMINQIVNNRKCVKFLWLFYNLTNCLIYHDL